MTIRRKIGIIRRLLACRLGSSFKKPIKLNIGSGYDFKVDYINIDQYVRAADLNCRIDRLIWFSDKSVDEVLANHVIEHIGLEMTKKVLKEWERILKPGGKIVIRVPNFELYVKEWLNSETEYKLGWGNINLFGHDKIGMYHNIGFTKGMLHRVISNAGLKIEKLEVVPNRHNVTNFEYRENGDIMCIAIKTECNL